MSHVDTEERTFWEKEQPQQTHKAEEHLVC